MNVTCPTCATVFRVDPAKVPERGVRARCSVCSGLIAVRRPEVAAPATPAATVPAPPRPEPVQPPPPPRPDPAVPTPPVTPEPLPTPEPPAPSPVPEPQPARRAESAPEPSQQARPPLATPQVPLSALPATEPGERPPAPAETVRGDATAQGATQAAPGRFSNPFLQQDPSTRARRLARALVSDLVVYHPEKRQRGLAEGNLKELFGEEIRKSWEEYVEQVGEELASTTPYFTEALNEILAEGEELFG